MDYATRLLLERGEFLCSTYGSGLTRVAGAEGGAFLTGADAKRQSGRAALAQRRAPSAHRAEARTKVDSPLTLGDGQRDDRSGGIPFPTAAAPPDAAEIQAIAASPARASAKSERRSAPAAYQPTAGSVESRTRGRPASKPRPPMVIALADDWRTQGDWLGRYGRYWACCCAICSPLDYLWGAGQEPVQYCPRIGPHCGGGDSLRYWVHWLYTADRRSLEMPATYLHSRVLKGLTRGDEPRRQAEWDDHGETYPRNHEGPDLCCTLRIPAGLFFLSLYDMNKDGHEGANRFRDYQLSIRPHNPTAPLQGIDGFEQERELAHARIHDFWGGVWKRFLVRGPAELTIRLARNGSLNAILAAVMLDPLEETPAPYFASDGAHTARAAESSESVSGEFADPVRAGLARLESDLAEHPTDWAARSRRWSVVLLRASTGASAPAAEAPTRFPPAPRQTAAVTCEYYCNLFADWERGQTACALTPARKIEKALRWDGVSWMGGGGCDAVKEWLAQRSAAAPARAGN